MDDLNKKLRRKYLRDLQKPSLTKFERATVIKQLMFEENLSQRSFAEKYGFTKSAVHDWVSYNKLSEEKYEEFKELGISEKEIVQVLRKKEEKSVEDEILYKHGLDSHLSRCDKFVRGFIMRYEVYKTKGVTYKSIDVVKNLQNNLNRLLMRLEKR